MRTTAAGAVGLLAARLAAADALASSGRRRRSPEPALHGLRITNGGPRYAGDHRLLTTVSPGRRGPTRIPVIEFGLRARARLELELLETSTRSIEVVQRHVTRLPAGRHRLPLKLRSTLSSGTYIVRIRVTNSSGKTRLYGPPGGDSSRRGRAPVVRILGVEASMDARSYAPGGRAVLRVESDARRLTLQMFESGREELRTRRRDELLGTPVSDAVELDWRGRRRGHQRLRVAIGDWPTGMYFARLTADDGAVGYAPFIVRSRRLGTSRTAIVLPTNTWQAYNFYDADGDGWGDTWYAGGSPPVVLDRPYERRGVPPHFHNYDLPFIRWLLSTGKDVEFLAEEDLERFRNGRVLRDHYDLVVFSGHSEYVTTRMYDIVERYRDLGGNLMFLSANSFFWKVRRRRSSIERVTRWRDVGRPESSLIGAQYLANDDGSIQDSFVVESTESAPWLFEATGLSEGSTFGHYGVEIDARTPHSPEGTVLLATLPDLFGPGLTGEMTYYETEAGARVFAAGAMAFGGSADRWVVGRLLENLWQRLAP